MCRKRADLIQAALEIVLADGFKRNRVQLIRERLLAEGQQPAAIRLHTDIHRWFEHQLPPQPVFGESCSETAIQKAALRRFIAEFRRAHKPAGVMYAVRGEAKRSYHPVAIEPM